MFDGRQAPIDIIAYGVCEIARKSNYDDGLLNPLLLRRYVLRLGIRLISPIGRHVLGKPDKEDWTIVQEKFRRSRPGK